MSKLRINDTSEWVVLSDEGNELILSNELIENAIIKARVVKYLGTTKELLQVFQDRVVLDAETLSHYKETGLFGDWICDSYICYAQCTIYKSFYYKLLDKHYVVIEMSTTDIKDAGKFRKLVPTLIETLDFQLIDEKNVLVCDGHELFVDTPSTFRFNSASSEDRLIFIGESKYLFVGIENKGSLEGLVQESIENAVGSFGFSKADSELFFCGSIECARYAITDNREVTNYGTYFKQKIGECEVLSFLLELGTATSDVSNLLNFREGQDEIFE